MTAPHQRSGRELRVLRAAVFAAVCVVLAGAGHALASCATVPLWTLGAGFLAVFAVACALAGRERSLPGIVAVLAVGQTVLHTLFGLGQGGGTAMGSGMGSGMSGMSMTDVSLVERAARIVCGTTAAAISPAQAQKILADARLDTGMTQTMHHPADAMSTSARSSMAVLPSLSMLLCHLLAAVAAGWVMRRGDMALLRLMRLSAHGVAEGALMRSLRGALALVRALRSGLPGTSGAAPLAPRTALLAPPKPRTTALQHTVVRRGPPSSTALVLAA
jgi:vacuolar-type H+-ATPase catalytic subunit A/Vma1